MTDRTPRDSRQTSGPSMDGGRWALIRVLVWGFALLGLVGVAAIAAFIIAMSQPRIALIAPPPEVDVDLPATTPPAPTLDDQGRSIVNPAWIVRPPIQYPEQALRLGVESGEAVIDCQVTTEGRISSCDIIKENPTDAGFGEAAVAGAMNARLHPQQIDGEAHETRIRYTARFRLE